MSPRYMPPSMSRKVALLVAMEDSWCPGEAHAVIADDGKHCPRCGLCLSDYVATFRDAALPMGVSA